MRRWLGWIAIGWLLVLCALALVAYGGQARPLSLDERARAVELGLRCPVCQSESVADSPSDIAKAMRAEIRQDLARGESAAAIRAFFVQRYGQWILLAPPSTGVGRFAWLTPPLLVVGGLGLLVMLVLEWRGRSRRRPATRSEYLERVRAELAAEGE